MKTIKWIKTVLCAALISATTIPPATASANKKPGKDNTPPYTAINMSRYEGKAHARIKEMDAKVRLSEPQKENILRVMRGYYGHKLTPQETAQRDSHIILLLTPAQQASYKKMLQQERAREQEKAAAKKARQKRKLMEREKNNAKPKKQ